MKSIFKTALSNRKQPGFTIIELIVIVSVIAVLAGIVIISYGSWRTSINQKQVRSDLIAAASAMEGIRNNDDQYPGTLPSTIQASNGVTLTVAYATKTQFCINGANGTTARYFVTESTKGDPQSGTCPAQQTVPAAPTALSVNFPTSSQAQISWVAPSGTVTKYELQCADEASYINNLKDVETTTLNATINGVTTNSYAVCHVRAQNSIGYGPWSDNFAFVVLGSPSNLVATTASASQINTSWDAVPGAQSYLLQWSTSSTFASITGSANGLTSTSRNVTGLGSQGVRYYFRVMAQLSGVNGGASTAANAITSINTPLAPTITASESGTGEEDSVTWSWPAITCPAGTSARYSTAYYRDDATLWRAWSANISGLTYAVTTSNQGYEYSAKVRSACITSIASSDYSTDSNNPSYVRQVTAPGVASGFHVEKSSATNQYGRTYEPSVAWWDVTPTCGPGTSRRLQIIGWANHTRVENGNTVYAGGGGQLAFQTDASTPNSDLQGASPNSDMAKAEYRWRTAWNNLLIDQYRTVAAANTDFDDTYYWKTWVPTSTNRASFGMSVSYGDVNTNLRGARVYVRYACVNTVTNRYAIGEPAMSNWQQWY